MKNILFLFSFLMVVCLSKAEENKFFVGVNGGGALTNFNYKKYKYDQLFNPTFKIHAGVMVDFRLKKSIFLSSGINYRVKGVRTDEVSFYDVNGNIILKKPAYDIKNKYISIPLFISYQWDKKIKIRIGIGGFYSYLLNSSIEYGAKVEGVSNPQNITEQYFSGDMGLTSKVGLLFPLGRNFYLNFEIIEELGLRNILIDDSITGKVTTQSLSAEIGLRYAF